MDSGQRNNNGMCSMEQLAYNHKHDQLGKKVFKITRDDNQVAPAIDDLYFLRIMEQELEKDKSNSWVAPLPFRAPRCRLPNRSSWQLPSHEQFVELKT